MQENEYGCDRINERLAKKASKNYCKNYFEFLKVLSRMDDDDNICFAQTNAIEIVSLGASRRPAALALC